MAYAGTLGAAGAVFFLGYAGTLIANSELLRIRRLVLACAALSVAAGAAHVAMTAGSMSGEAAGMWDGSLIRMVWQAGEGRALEIRTIGLSLASLAMLKDRPAAWGLLGAAIPEIKAALARVTIAQCEAIAKRSLEAYTVGEVDEILSDALGELFQDLLSGTGD